MGITQKSLDRINNYLQPKSKILIIGCQNLYNSENYGHIAAVYFREFGHAVKDIDIYECNGCEIADLREDWKAKADFDLVLQHGTIEHVDGSLYTPLLNIHNSCKVGCIMIHENPLTDNWPQHGQHYFTPDFWENLAKLCEHELLENTTESAMGNTVDGWNSCAVLRKNSNKDFITEDQFNKLYNAYIQPK